MSTEFDINSHLNLMRFGQNGGGSSEGGAAGEAITPDDLLKKSVDKGIQTVVKVITSLLGVHTNPDIEGKGVTSSLDAQNIGSGLSLTNLGIIRQESGGGFLSMLWDMIKRHITRDVTPLTEGTGGDAFASGGGSSGGGGDTYGDSGGGTAMAGGGGDMPSALPGMGGGADMHDVQVNYGGKMVSADAMVGNLGNLSPPETPVARNEGRGGADMSV